MCICQAVPAAENMVVAAGSESVVANRLLLEPVLLLLLQAC